MLVADSNKSDDKSDKDGEEKSVGEKIVDIIHSVFHKPDDSGDPVTDTIKSLRKNSLIGGDYRKAKMDKAIKDSGG
jgi:hypothetical protein